MFNSTEQEICFDSFDSLRPINNLSVIKGRAFLGWASTKLGLMFLLKGHNTVTPVRLDPAAPRSRVKHSTTLKEHENYPAQKC